MKGFLLLARLITASTQLTPRDITAAESGVALRLPPHSIAKGRNIVRLFCIACVALLLAGVCVGRPVADLSGGAVPQYRGYHRAEAEFRAMQLRDENGQIPTNALLKALEQKRQMPYLTNAWPGTGAPVSGPRRLTAGLRRGGWTALGPNNVGGRVRALVIHPTSPGTMWAGGVGGGIWKTLNGGFSWFPLNDFMGTLAIGSLCIDPTDPDTLYAGTGEGFSNGDSLRGAGIFKTTDGGLTWSQLSATANSSFYFVNRLALCPTNHLVLLAATSNGIWRSTDGGVSFTHTYNGGAMLDLDFHPTDGSLCIAGGRSGTALYSTDGGITWTAAAGLPSSGRVEVAYAPSAPDTVYASLENGSGQLYLSTDGGASYTLRNSGMNYLGSQGWYDDALWVDPTNPNILIVGGIDLWLSTDGGASLNQISQWYSAPESAHADHHCIVNHPAFDGVANRTVYFCNDGGVYSAQDVYTVSLTSGWIELNNNLGITQFYGAAGNTNSGRIVGGTQDNGTLRYTPQSGALGWTEMYGGDGGFCAADPVDTNYFYGEYVYLQIHRSTDGGSTASFISGGIGDAGVPGGGEAEENDPDASANFIAPFILDPNNANTMLAGGSNLWRTLNVKAISPAWSNIKPGATNGTFISTIAVASGNSDIIWVGHNNGDIWATANGTSASPAWARMDLGSPNLPNRACTRITIDPADTNRVYATFGGFNSDNVWRTTDGGATWSNLAAGLPSAPVRSLVIAPFNTNYLYVGTEVGVFASADGGATWSPGNEGPADASVNELFWMGRTLVAATHGRGVWQIAITDRPVLTLAQASLAAENCPPGNGLVDPGETVIVNFTLVNTGAYPTTNLTATLQATPGVVSLSDAQSYGAVAPGATVTRAFAFTAAGACGGTINPTLQLQDGTNNLGTVTTSFQLGSQNVSWAEAFDTVQAPALPSGWTVTWSGAGSAWATVFTAADTSPNSAFAPDPSNPSDNQLVSPPVTVPGSGAQLEFRHSYNTELTYDGGVLEISIGGGAFTDIITAGGSFVTNGYTQVISTATDNVLDGRPAWTGNSGGFITTIVNLPPAAAGQTVQFRWRLATDTGTGAGGWYVDSISLLNGVTCCTGAYVDADVGVSGQVAPVATGQGSNITFTATVTNLGLSIATGTLLGDTLPPQLSFVSASASQGTWSYNNGSVTFDVGALSNAATAALSITAQAMTNGVFTNTLTVTASTPDPMGSNNSVSFVFTVARALDISSLAFNNDAAVLTWGSIPNRTYRVQFKNDLADPAWTDVTPDIAAASTTSSFTNSVSGAGQRFYRVVLLP